MCVYTHSYIHTCTPKCPMQTYKTFRNCNCRQATYACIYIEKAHMYVCTYIHIYVNIHIYICKYIYIHSCRYINMYIHIQDYVYIYVCLRQFLSVTRS